MTTEQYDFKANKNNTHFNRLLLGGDVSKLVNDPDYHVTDLQIDLKINGHQVVIKDFNEVLTDWSTRIETQILESRGITDFEEAVKQKAQQLLKEKLNDVQTIDRIYLENENNTEIQPLINRLQFNKEQLELLIIASAK